MGFKERDSIECVHRKFCKYVLNISYRLPNAVACGECGRFPLYVEYYTKCIKYWLRVISLPFERFSHQCYLSMRQTCKRRHPNWCTHIRDLLYEYGFGIVWKSQEVGNSNVFINLSEG